jgi:hypothetical protein
MSANARTWSSPVGPQSGTIRPAKNGENDGAKHRKPQVLHQHLRAHGRAEIDGWVINADGAEIWLTNPYGLDVGFYANDAEGCASILERISTDDHEREWGSL